MLDWTILFDLSDKYLFEQELTHDISPDDREDIRQNVFLGILNDRKMVIRLSPERLEKFIDRMVGRYSKRWQRHRERFVSMEDSQVPTVNEIHQGERNEHDDVAFQLDMVAILQSFTPEQRDVCGLLLERSLRRGRETARITRHSVDCELKTIRERFLRAGYGKN